MELTNLKLSNFRSYDKLNLSFSNKYNIIYGNNGSGKTNLVEAIYLLALSKSFRVNLDKLLIKKGEKELSVEGKIKTKVKTKYKITVSNDTKIVEIDNNKVNKMSDYVSNINVVLYNPDDIFLIKDAPSERRKLLNIEISKMYKEYLILLNDYNKVLKIRNSYLKEMYRKNITSFEYLDILTEKMIDIGLKIENFRNDFVEDINKYITGIYQEIFGYGNLTVKYVSNYKNKNHYEILKIYQNTYQKELENGKTLMGIHHDDIIFYLDKNKLKEWGSVGQLKNSIISFKLAELRLVKERKNDCPILILDDLFSELDDIKIKNILKILDNDIQIFITTTNIKNFKKKNYDKYKIFKVENSVVMEEDNGK